MNVVLRVPNSTAGEVVIRRAERSDTGKFTAKKSTTPRKAQDKEISGAVFKYIQAVRSLGHTRITTAAIADALALEPRQVA